MQTAKLPLVWDKWKEYYFLWVTKRKRKSHYSVKCALFIPLKYSFFSVIAEYIDTLEFKNSVAIEIWFSHSRPPFRYCGSETSLVSTESVSFHSCCFQIRLCCSARNGAIFITCAQPSSNIILFWHPALSFCHLLTFLSIGGNFRCAKHVSFIKTESNYGFLITRPIFQCLTLALQLILSRRSDRLLHVTVTTVAAYFLKRIFAEQKI
jgi:hypothetical protein